MSRSVFFRNLGLTLLMPFLFSASLNAVEATAGGAFEVKLSAAPFADRLLPDSSFGINTAFQPDTPNLEAILQKMKDAGIKWGRQDFTWRRIEREKGKYEFADYDRLVDLCRQYGLLLFANLAYGPDFHDPRTAEGVRAYCDFARAAVRHFAGKIKHWQIWNEPNGGFWKGTPQQYASLLTAAGKAIHEADPNALVLGLNMAFCDVLWAEKILELVPYDCFDVACFHPYRVPSAPEEPFDWWELDQYVKSWHRNDLKPDYPLVRMSFLEQTAELQKVMAKFGRPKPIWITEICWNTQIHPYGVPELRQADMAVRFHVLAIASGKVDKVFWWTLRDTGTRQFDQADMVGLLRNDLSPKYAYYAFAFMTRMLEGRKWLRNDAFGPDIYAAVFTDPAADADTIVAWTTKPYAYIRVNNEKGLTQYDIYGTRRFVPVVEIRTTSLPIPLGASPIYIVGAKGLKATVRPDPGW
ncbi:MAG: beta-galactosidase [Sedimentisphaerales bacterium]|nr:beta-galactosidase [Sedimentisphaerales bacterium]